MRFTKTTVVWEGMGGIEGERGSGVDLRPGTVPLAGHMQNCNTFADFCCRSKTEFAKDVNHSYCEYRHSLPRRSCDVSVTPSLLCM